MEKKMARRFEDLIAWQKARDLPRKVYRITENGAFARDFGLRDQVRRSSVSIMSNLAEGFERGRRTEFHQYLSIAKSSCAELRSHLYVALDARHVDERAFCGLMVLAEEVAKILGGLRSAVQKQD
ncbi:MAG: four helix bundle protein [Nitrospiraceae bacterium]